MWCRCGFWAPTRVRWPLLDSCKGGQKWLGLRTSVAGGSSLARPHADVLCAGGCRLRGASEELPHKAAQCALAGPLREL